MDFTDDFLVIAAVVCAGQRIFVEFFFEFLILYSTLLGGFVHRRFLIFDHLRQLLIRCVKGDFLLMKFF